jgi:hypothetical protein
MTVYREELLLIQNRKDLAESSLSAARFTNKQHWLLIQ